MKPIVYLGSSLIAKPKSVRSEGDVLDYFASLTSKIVNTFRDYDVVVKLPSSDGDEGAIEQREMFKVISNNPVGYSAIILGPAKTNVLNSYVRQYLDTCCVGGPNPPLLTIDKRFYPEVASGFSEWTKYGGTPPSVIVDSHAGGQLGAIKLIEELSRRYNEIKIKYQNIPKYRPRILVVSGLEGSENRVKGFTEVINKERASGADIDVDYQEAGFTREMARELMHIHLGHRNPYYFDGYFCCNDAMALGVRDFLEERISNSYHVKHLRPCIVGFDGTGEFIELMSSDQFLFGTVDVNLADQVGKLLEMTKSIIRDPSKRVPVDWITQDSRFVEVAPRWVGLAHS